MSLRKPRRGDVIRYNYLWADERQRGRSFGSKDRPVLVVAISVITQNDKEHLLVLAVTHTPPRDSGDAVELPAPMKQRLGLDTRPSWIVTTEANAFVWSEADARLIPRRASASVVYGSVPASFRLRCIAAFLENRKRQRAAIIVRD